MIRGTFVALTALVVTAFSDSATAATSAGGSVAVTLRALSVVKVNDLEFGTLVPSSLAGTATINPNTDARSTTGGAVGATGAIPSAAHFTAAGVPGAIALIALPGSITLTRIAGTETMNVTGISSNGPTLRTFPATPTIDVSVGGTLNVAANQVAGDYSGSFTVTVLYF